MSENNTTNQEAAQEPQKSQDTQDTPQVTERVTEKQHEEAVSKAKTSNVDPDEVERMRLRIAELNEENMKRRLQVKEYKETWGELDVDPDKVRELLDKEKKAAEDRKKAEGKYEELIKEINEKTQKEVAQLKQEKEQVEQQMQSKLEKYLLDKELAEALNSEGVKTKVLNPHIKPNLKVIEDDLGEYRAVVVDKDGEPRLNQEGKLMGIKDLLEEMKKDEDFMPLFPAPTKSGAGTKSSTNNSTTSAPKRGIKRGEMSPKQKVEYQKEYGMEAYNKLPF